MATCIYTGAYVYFNEYGSYAPADLFQCGNQVLIQWQPGGLTYEAARQPTHEIRIGFGYHHEDRGITVVADENCIGERR